MSSKKGLDDGARSDDTEIVVALVAAVGTDVGMVSDLLQTEFNSYRFTSTVTRLSAYLNEKSGRVVEATEFFDETLWEAMTDGDLLRERWDRNDALALHAVSDIVADRSARAKMQVETEMGHFEPESLQRHAFILRSLKTPDELATLRSIYGPRLIVISAYSPRRERKRHLGRLIRDSRKSKDRSTWSHLPKDLMRRDESEARVGGQDVSGTFHQADFFIRATNRKVAKTDIGRTLRVLFGDPFETPTPDEEGQFIAAGAAMRSSELGRQVGAAITTRDGAVLAVGTNEVPKSGGGSHWIGEASDNRDFALRGRDTNREHLDELTSQVSSAVAKQLRAATASLKPGKKRRRKFEEAFAGFDRALPETVRKAGLKDLTEFGRAVHAEMNALLGAARRGVPVQDATLYSTTFPCHNCARHIIGAGIGRVVFVEPYPKSRAALLHGDSMSLHADSGTKVSFEPFVGVAPRRFLEMFDAGARERAGYPARKNDDGTCTQLDKPTARPVFPDIVRKSVRPALPAYREREVLALATFVENDTALDRRPLRSDPSEAAGTMAS